MAYQKFFESDEDFKACARKEALEKSSGLSQGIFESDEAYEQRALRVALEKTSGVSQGIFESDESYQKRASKITLEKISGLSQGLIESDEAYEKRALQEAVERTSETSRRLFESESSYQDRAMRSLADNPYGQKGYVYLMQESMQESDMEPFDTPLDSDIEYSRTNETNPIHAESSPILKGIEIGLLVDAGIILITFGGLLLDLLFGKQNYNFVLVIPPLIGGIIGAISSLKSK